MKGKFKEGNFIEFDDTVYNKKSIARVEHLFGLDEEECVIVIHTTCGKEFVHSFEDREGMAMSYNKLGNDIGIDVFIPTYSDIKEDEEFDLNSFFKKADKFLDDENEPEGEKSLQQKFDEAQEGLEVLAGLLKISENVALGDKQ